MFLGGWVVGWMEVKAVLRPAINGHMHSNIETSKHSNIYES
jgi:hypothetical protein